VEYQALLRIFVRTFYQKSGTRQSRSCGLKQLDRALRVAGVVAVHDFDRLLPLPRDRAAQLRDLGGAGHAGPVSHRFDTAGHSLNSRLCRVPGGLLAGIDLTQRRAA
jgi:hypothetical protein